MRVHTGTLLHTLSGRCPKTNVKGQRVWQRYIDEEIILRIPNVLNNVILYGLYQGYAQVRQVIKLFCVQILFVDRCVIDVITSSSWVEFLLKVEVLNALWVCFVLGRG